MAMLFWLMLIHLDMPIYVRMRFMCIEFCHPHIQCRSNMRNHADMRIFMRSCVTEGNRNTRNRIQEITNFHSSYNSVDQRSSRFRNPSEFTSLILKAHRSFSSGVPEPVMSVANMNSCFREFMWRGWYHSLDIDIWSLTLKSMLPFWSLSKIRKIWSTNTCASIHSVGITKTFLMKPNEKNH